MFFSGKSNEFLNQYYYHSLLRIACKYTANQKASDDLVQEVFVPVWEKQKQLSRDHEKSIEHYLVRVVKFKSISYYKKNHRLEESKLNLRNNNRLASIEHSVDANLKEAELYQELRTAIAFFPTKEYEAIIK